MTEPRSFDAYMDEWHGGFLKMIAWAVAKADADNKEKLRQHWPEVVRAYEWPDHTKAPKEKAMKCKCGKYDIDRTFKYASVPVTVAGFDLTETHSLTVCLAPTEIPPKEETE